MANVRVPGPSAVVFEGLVANVRVPGFPAVVCAGLVANVRGRRPMSPSFRGRDQPDDQLRGLGIVQALMCQRLPGLEGDAVADSRPAQS